MLNVAAPGKFVLTLQSIPPFLIESILAFALAVLLAVPLIARLQIIFANRVSCVKSPNPISISTRQLHRHNHHIITQYPSPMITTSCSSQSFHLNSMHINNSYYDIQQSIQTLTSVPFIEQSLDRNENKTKAENAEDKENGQINNYMIIGDNPVENIANFEYQHYRHKLIKENFKKKYGHLQAPGNFVLNSIHLSSMDSQRGIDDKCNSPLFISNVGSSNVNDVSHENTPSECVDQRDLFLTKKKNDKLETVDKTVGTEHSSVERSQPSELINIKEHANTSTESRRKSRAITHSIEKDKLSNHNTDNDHGVKIKIDLIETNLRPNTPKKNRKLSSIRPKTPSSPSKPIRPADTEILNASNRSPIIETANKFSDITGEVPVIVAKERNENSPSHVASVIGKSSSMASSEAFSNCSSKNAERRTINTRLGLSNGGGIRGSLKHLLPKVNSRPRSSGASFAWEVPDIPHKVPSYEKPIERKIISNTKRPKSSNISATKKKSEVLSVLESIMDLSCETTIDFQESTIEMDIQNFRKMYDNAELTGNVLRQIEESSRAISVTNKKTRLPISSSNQKRNNFNGKSIGGKKETKPYLRSRSGIYSKRPDSSESRN